MSQKIGNVLNDLAYVLYREAEKLDKDAIKIGSRVEGPDFRDTAWKVYLLAGIEARKGNRSEALSFLRQSLDHGLPKIRALEMEYDPDFKSLYREPRFITMVAAPKNARQQPKHQNRGGSMAG